VEKERTGDVNLADCETAFPLVLRFVATREELDRLSSEELHDRATQHALRHANVKFFWDLLRALPAAEASTGDVAEAWTDVQSAYGRLNDLREAGHGDVADALRPLYIEYLAEHT
jgi:hypothetical protein